MGTSELHPHFVVMFVVIKLVDGGYCVMYLDYKEQGKC
jgi:hypothetical protein